jgi:dihydropteroate synthase
VASAAAVAPSNPIELGARTVVCEGLDPEAERAVRSASPHLRVTRVGSRLALGGSPGELLDLARALANGPHPSLGAELRAAVQAFEAQLTAPPATLLMGVLNVTPDSFSDGGEWLDPRRAVDHALEMVEQGASVIDIGGESTRPGAEEVSVEEELRRVMPVIEALRPRTQALLSIDTRKAPVARAALAAGVDWVNDISGMTHDPAIGKAVAEHPRAVLVLMHSRARPAAERYSTAYDPTAAPVYEDVVADTLRWLRVQARRALALGISADRLWIDPGFGFGKTFEQNVELLRRLREYTSAGLPVLLGTSRKSSVGKLLGDLPPDQRLEGTAATVAFGVAQGAAGVRVHDVREIARVCRVVDALR